MNLSIDYNKVKSSLELKNCLKKLIIGSAIVLNLSPLFLKNNLNNNAKLLLASSGFVFALCCLKLPSTDYEERLIKTYKDTGLKQQKTILSGEVLKHQTELEILNQQELARTIEKLPGYQVPYFASKYGVTPIMASAYIEENQTNKNNEEIPVLNIPKNIFTNIIEKCESKDKTSLEWLKKAINESCFIAGKKGSGKSHLMRWLLSGFIAQSNKQDIFYIIDKHYDFDNPWIIGIDENELIENERIVDGDKAIEKIKELHNLLLNRIKNKLTFKKLGMHTRILIDEIDSYSNDDMEVISSFVRDVEYQGRKYGFSLVLGSHSIKKNEMKIDSSVVSSMINILFPSIVLDRNSILSGAFPSLPKMKLMIEDYKYNYLPNDGRMVIINDDSNVFVSHIPKLDLTTIKITEDENVSNVEKTEFKTENDTNSEKNPLDKIRKWCDLCFQKYQVYPSKSLIKKAWFEETNQDLSDNGLDLLIEKIGINKN